MEVKEVRPERGIQAARAALAQPVSLAGLGEEALVAYRMGPSVRLPSSMMGYVERSLSPGQEAQVAARVRQPEKAEKQPAPSGAACDVI